MCDGERKYERGSLLILRDPPIEKTTNGHDTPFCRNEVEGPFAVWNYGLRRCGDGA